jgi:two-component system KDP operon response regulator KdpE
MVVSTKCREKDIIESLDAGANDFISKPFQNGELLARIRTAFRNLPSIVPEPVISNKNFEMNLVTRTVKVNKEILRLTAIQYQLLAVLVKNEGKTLNHNYLLNEIWGKEFINEFQYLRVFIAQLRKKLEQFPDCGLSISTESGVGYRFIMK